MSTYKHIVQVHPVENGEPNLHKVIDEEEYDLKEHADAHIKRFNEYQGREKADHDGGRFADKKYDRFRPKNFREFRAVYYGRVNTETGELE